MQLSKMFLNKNYIDLKLNKNLNKLKIYRKLNQICKIK